MTSKESIIQKQKVKKEEDKNSGNLVKLNTCKILAFAILDTTCHTSFSIC